uniref:Uncharacterized protein n=1 Tax=Anguilla anguilla TaxID=7936 RepID=A0A0E9WY90_ANGAN
MAEEQKDFSKYFTGLFFKRMMIKKNLLDFYILKRKKTENQNKFWFFPVPSWSWTVCTCL